MPKTAKKKKEYFAQKRKRHRKPFLSLPESRRCLCLKSERALKQKEYTSRGVTLKALAENIHGSININTSVKLFCSTDLIIHRRSRRAYR